MSKLAASIDTMRLVSLNGTVAFFDFVIGVQTDAGEFVPVIKIRDNSLKPSQNDDSYWVAYPSKLRTRNGAPVQENGRNKYDDIVSNVMEQVDSKWQGTEASFKFKKYIEGLATAKYLEMVAEGGEAPAPRAAAPAPARTPQRAPAPAAAAASRASAATDFDFGY